MFLNNSSHQTLPSFPLPGLAWGLGGLQMESLSFLYRSQAGASPLICSGMLTCCCSSVGQARRNQYACYTVARKAARIHPSTDRCPARLPGTHVAIGLLTVKLVKGSAIIAPDSARATVSGLG